MTRRERRMRKRIIRELRRKAEREGKFLFRVAERKVFKTGRNICYSADTRSLIDQNKLAFWDFLSERALLRTAHVVLVGAEVLLEAAQEFPRVRHSSWYGWARSGVESQSSRYLIVHHPGVRG